MRISTLLGAAHLFGLVRKSKPAASRVELTADLRCDQWKSGIDDERRRWAEVFACQDAVENPRIATAMLETNSLSSRQIIHLMAGWRRRRTPSLYERMAAYEASHGRIRVGPGGAEQPNGDAAIAASWAKAAASVG